MRLDKLTTQFQQALADAQSLALANDNQYIEPVHLLAAIVAEAGGSGRALLERAGVRVPSLKTALDGAIQRLPQVSGTGGEVQVGSDLVNLLNLSEMVAGKRGDQLIATEMFLLALAED
jgi:ATP-dependent Clp protease ATP-binding subunit ClpB